MNRKIPETVFCRNFLYNFQFKCVNYKKDKSKKRNEKLEE